MAKCRVKKYFMIETEHISVVLNANSKWDYIGTSNNYIRLHRNGVFIDIPKDTFERYFSEWNN